MRRAALPSLAVLLACGPFFYQAPPSLGTYPERVPAKRWQHLFTEAMPADPASPDEAAMDEACRGLVASLGSMTPAQQLAEIDRLLHANRHGSYSSRRANLLHELREIVADPDLLRAAGGYLRWRIEHDVSPPAAPPAEKPWDMDEEVFNNLKHLFEFQVKQRLTFFKDQLAGNDARMKPYWLVRRAAFQFTLADFPAALADLDEVTAAFPDHPRAEAAVLLLARCRIEQARFLERAADADQKTDDIRALRDDTDTILTEFIARHPQGRFTPDAIGWQAAIASDQKRLGRAVALQLERLKLQPTREITRSTLRECDRLFETLLASPETAQPDAWLDPDQWFDAAAVARHPLAARLFVQHCIDPAAHIDLPMWWDDSESGGRSTIDFLKRRILRPTPFVQLALAGLGRELIKAQSVPDATTLTLLAWSATEEGEHEQALALLERIPADVLTDEAWLAKAVVEERMGHAAEALASLERLATLHPASPLLADLPYRKSRLLHRTGQQGKALLEVLPLTVHPRPQEPDGEVSTSVPAALRLHPSEELAQWLDTLLQFSPLDQLGIALAGSKRLEHTGLLRDAIRMRALAAGDFPLAAAHLADSETPVSVDDWRPTPLDEARTMTRASWDRHAAPLADMHARLRDTLPPSETARLHLTIAREWMKQRGRLTLPSLTLGKYAASEDEKQDLLRRRNAQQLGFSRDAIQLELDRRDEATHALEHALIAAQSGDPAVAAPALELANECLFRRAEFSLYQKSRALETDATALSADLHSKLTSRFPESAEAKRAVRFTFTPSAGPWMPGDYNIYNSASALIGSLHGYELGQEPDDSDALAKIETIAGDFESLDPKASPAATRRRIEAAKRQLDEARALTLAADPRETVGVIDRLDDLLAATHVPGVRGEDLSRYASGDPASLPPGFRSLLDYRERLATGTDAEGNETGPTNDTIAGWREFLDRYPQSPKAEAASFRLTRLIARQYRTSRRIAAFHFPEAPIPGGYKRVEVIRMDPANDPEAVIAAIRAHEQRFPQGRYRDDLALLEAGARIDAGKFPQALALLDGVLSNPVQKDLHVIAALELADIAQRLLTPDERGAVAQALRKSPAHLERLRRMVDGDTFLSRAKPLMAWLEGS